LDLFAGNQSRPHQDLDIGILRRDVLKALAALPSWECFEAKHGVLTRLASGTAPRADVNSLWCRPAEASEWTLELMLDESDEGRWVYRRQPGIQRPLEMTVRRDPQGIPYLAPEVQLLYKSRRARPKDHADFEHIAPKLDLAACEWLRDALAISEPGHRWLSPLDARLSA
jgi:hypothetical protein